MKKSLLWGAGVCAGLVLLFSAGAAGSGDVKVECAGNICIHDHGGISPSKLPRHGTAPVTAVLAGKITTRDGSHPPAARTLSVDIDKTIDIDAVGLPTCRKGQLVARSSAAAKSVCGDAIVGSGEAEVEVAFPEQTPFRSSGPLVAFNGGVHGKTTVVFLHAYVNVPAPTAVVVRATVTKIHRGRFGLQIDAQIPSIAGGAGSATGFDLKVGRKYTYRGKRKSFLVAGCPTGSWMTSGNVLFSDQTRVSVTHLFTCTPTG